ncbi:methyl-accepting chemotaxis protein [Phaeobacter sp. BS23]|uniref:methyl-accepting chemotaxis protein n=1 Tax=Phaeobacter sp. BS23 TaxID=2907239 RepID=UPI00386FD85B
MPPKAGWAIFARFWTRWRLSDLTQRMPEGQKGIFKEIANAVDNLSDNLTGMVQQLSHSSEVLNSTAAEIAAAADDASRRGETSAASLEETAAALQTLDDTVRGTAEGSEQAKDIVRDAFTQARTTSELASQTISAMQRIEDSSGAIAKITDLIEDLAFQTNLLALNAGVEAARAGEAGRGFAVVASEVRGLAQRSADAVQEINQLIDVSTHEVAQGVKLVDQTGTALASIQSSVEAVVGKVEQIAATTVEQSNGLSEVNTAVVSLDQNAQKNSAMLEQTAAALARCCARKLRHWCRRSLASPLIPPVASTSAPRRPRPTIGPTPPLMTGTPTPAQRDGGKDHRIGARQKPGDT